MDMKNFRNLAISLSGAGSVLEIFPDSDIDAELLELQKMTDFLAEMQGRLVQPSCYPGRLTSILATHRAYEFSVPCRVDHDALAHDWRSVGGDFLHAYQKALPARHKPLRKEESDCGKL